MIKSTTIQLLKTLPLFVFLLTAQFTSAQSLWNGDGDGTSWEDAANWVDDVVPPVDSLIAFEVNATVTGTQVNDHLRINLNEGAIVTFDLDLSIGDGASGEHGIVVGASSTLTLASGRTFTINCASNKQALAIFNSADMAAVVIEETAIINIMQASNGINLKNANSSITNNGTINFASDVKNGIKSEGAFTNNGAINFDALITVGVQVKGGDFVNNGTMTITKPGNDCIEILGGGMMTNYGTLALVALDSSATAKNAIAIGSDSDEGTFLNETSGVISADGGASTNGRAVSVNEMGTLINLGMMTITGGNETARLYNKGTSTNGMNAIMDFTDGRANINAGTFTNGGLLVSTREGAGIFTSENATVVNNAFFNYNTSNNFAAGMGTITNNGLSVNNARVNTMNNCNADIAEMPYEWFIDGAAYATADATGNVNFSAMSIAADSVLMTTTLPGVEVKVVNICEEAVIMTAVFSPSSSIEALSVYPTLLNGDQMLTINLSNFPLENIPLMIYNVNGQLLQQHMTQGAEELLIPTHHLNTGLHFIKAQYEGKIFIGKFIK